MHEIVTEEKHYICMFCYLCLSGFCFQGQIQQNSCQLLKYSDIPLNHTAVNLFITIQEVPWKYSHMCWTELLNGKSSFRVVIFFPYSAVVHFVLHLIYFYCVERYVVARYFFKSYICDTILMLKCILPLHWLSCAVWCLSVWERVQECGPKEI